MSKSPPRQAAPPKPSQPIAKKVTPKVPASPVRAPAAGDWLWTCREQFEKDVSDELRARDRALDPVVIAPALVLTRGAPALREGALDVTFARQALPVYARIVARGVADLDAQVTRALRACVTDDHRATPWALHVWVPDATDANRLGRSAETLQRSIELRAGTVDARWADARVPNAAAAKSASGLLLQVCLLEPHVAVVGVLAANLAPSLHPGGRARMRVSDKAPSRAAMKIEEAIDWLGHGPERGELCVDLGAAPGGWTYVVMERGARVIAIDPGSMAPDLMERRGLRHIRGSAFDYEPDESVDWLLCDMVWRPLEVASLLARWARKRWTRFMIANIKLPMRGKVEFLVRIRATLTEGGWQGLRLRQLYHDREEITLTAFSPR